jgi:pyruvate/2-oxoglutarate dehydrogenase complex dihydrolipoamide acyltransferase (E2) component
VDVTMPQMGVSVAEGTLVEWRKQPGDRVEADEIICSISTDKIDTEVESPASGRVAELLIEVGETVDVGVVLARIETDAAPGGGPDGSANGAASASAATSEAGAALEAPGDAGELQGDAPPTGGESQSERTSLPKRGGPRRYSPVVTRMAAEHSIDLDAVPGTGRDGRVRKQDVLAYLESRHGDDAPEPPMHIESPYRPDPVPPKAPPVAARPRPPLPAISGRPRASRCRASGRRSGAGCSPPSTRRPPARPSWNAT